MSAEPHYRAYETIVSQVDKGNKVKSERIVFDVDSDDSSYPKSQQKVFVNGQKKLTNSIVGPLVLQREKFAAARLVYDKEGRRKLIVPTKSVPYFKQHQNNEIDYMRQDNNNEQQQQPMGPQNSIAYRHIRPRNVESPALSVDSGGRSSGASVRLAKGIQKLFNVEQGHYTDLYERIEKHKSLDRRRPVDVIDERLGLQHHRH